MSSSKSPDMPPPPPPPVSSTGADAAQAAREARAREQKRYDFSRTLLGGQAPQSSDGFKTTLG